MPNYYDTMPRGYHVDIAIIPHEPDEPLTYYWKLYHDESGRINGGIAKTPEYGRTMGRVYAHQHGWYAFTSTHFWDEESHLWIPKEQLNR